MRFTRARRVYLYDTDASGLLFFGAPARWLAEAEADLLGSLGVGILDGGFGVPVRSVTIEYLEPLELHENVHQEAWISRVGRTSFTITHQFSKEGGQVAVSAETRHVYVRMTDVTPHPVPTAIRRGLVVDDSAT